MAHKTSSMTSKPEYYDPPIPRGPIQRLALHSVQSVPTALTRDQVLAAALELVRTRGSMTAKDMALAIFGRVTVTGVRQIGTLLSHHRRRVGDVVKLPTHTRLKGQPRMIWRSVDAPDQPPLPETKQTLHDRLTAIEEAQAAVLASQQEILRLLRAMLRYEPWPE